MRLLLFMCFVSLLSCSKKSLIGASSEYNNDLYITPQMFGAVADGKVDNSKAMQSAIDEAILNKRKLYIPSGSYRIEQTLKIDGPITIEGETRYGSYLWFDPKLDKSLFEINGGKKTKWIHLRSMKLGLRSYGEGKSDVHAIKVVNSTLSNFRLNEIEFFGFSGCGLYLTGKNTYGQNLAFRDLSFYRMGGMIGQNNDRGISDWWVNLVIFENIHLDAYSGHSINLQSPQQFIFDIRGWRMVQITNLLIEGSIKENPTIKASVRVGGGYTSNGSNYLGLGNVTINGFWEEFSSKTKPEYSVLAIEGISSLNIMDYKATKMYIQADAMVVNINGIRLHGLNTKDRFRIEGRAKVILDNVLNSMNGKVNIKSRSNSNIEIRSYADKYKQ